jgi:hypothetical protein
VQGLGGATHAYSFWEGIPQEGRGAFGRLFASSKSLKVRVQPPFRRLFESSHSLVLAATVTQPWHGASWCAAWRGLACAASVKLMMSLLAFLLYLVAWIAVVPLSQHATQIPQRAWSQCFT